MRKFNEVFLIFLMVCCVSPLIGQEQGRMSVLEISETASVAAMPNQANVSFAVETDSEDAQEAIRLNAALTDSVLNALKSSVGDDDSLSTSGFNLSPVYARREPSQLVSYRVKNSVSLTTKQVDALGALIDLAVEAGVSRIDSLSFSHDKEQDLRNQAAVKALQRAKKTAVKLAEAAGMRVKRILVISYSPPGPVRRYARMAVAESAPTPIEVGQLAISATVNVEFEIE